MPRIDFTAPLIVTDTEDRRIADWSILSQFVGRSFENTDILRYFGQSIDEVPVAVLLDRSGDIQILANSRNNSLLAKSSLRSIRMLTAEELDALQNYVEVTWSDGVGECLELDDMSFYLDLDQVDRRQEDDGVVSLGSGMPSVIVGIVSLNGRTLGGPTACRPKYPVHPLCFMALLVMPLESPATFTGRQDHFARSNLFAALHGTNPPDNGLFIKIGTFALPMT